MSWSCVKTSFLLSFFLMKLFCWSASLLCFLQVDLCCFDKTGTLTSDDMVCYLHEIESKYLLVELSTSNILSNFNQEFSGVGGLTESEELETDMSKVPGRALEILASCHALVFVDNKLV